MKRIHRNPETFATLDLFDAIAQRTGLKLDEAASEEGFFSLLRGSLARSRSNPAVIHGRRIETMFEYVVASLGKCVLIKREDTGEISSSIEGVTPPDFRLVLSGGLEIFVEVKNCHRRDPNYRYKLTPKQVGGLEAYARAFGRELFIAIFWSQWKKWTLTRVSDFQVEGPRFSMSFLEAIQRNRMVVVGDALIATEPPLAIRVFPDPTKLASVDSSGLSSFTAGSIEFYCNNRRIDDPFEQQLALYFMLYSEWVTAEPRVGVSNNMPTGAELIVHPSERTEGQVFEMLGSLSDMIARRYNELTAPEGCVVRLSPMAEPDTLGVLIPETYQGKSLPLWIFTMNPHDRAGI